MTDRLPDSVNEVVLRTKELLENLEKAEVELPADIAMLVVDLMLFVETAKRYTHSEDDI